MAHNPNNGASASTAPAQLPYRSINGPPRSRARWVVLALLVLAVVAGLAIFHFRGTIFFAAPATAAGGRHGSMAVPVVVAKSRSADVDVWLTGLGTVTAYNTVTVRTRVDGELTKIFFTEGQTVKTGDLLAQIDPGPYQAALEQAQGQLLRDQALLKNAKIDLDRYNTLVAQNSITQQQRDTQAALVDQYQGAVGADQGQVHAAQVNLDYTRITSPIDGRIGLRQVDQGNIVHATDATGLAVITQLQPIALIFGLPQEEIPQVMSAMKLFGAAPVIARDKDAMGSGAVGEAGADGGGVLDVGKMLTINNQVDMTTGNALIKAEMPNKDNTLFPNQFANGWLLAEQRTHVVVVPTAAIQFSPTGTFVYVVVPDDSPKSISPAGAAGATGGPPASKVKIQPVTIFTADKPNIRIEEHDRPNANITVVESDLSSGETVVIDGVDKLQDGSSVIPKAGAFGKHGASTTQPGDSGAKSSPDSDKPTTRPHHHHHDADGGGA